MLQFFFLKQLFLFGKKFFFVNTTLYKALNNLKYQKYKVQEKAKLNPQIKQCTSVYIQSILVLILFVLRNEH